MTTRNKTKIAAILILAACLATGCKEVANFFFPDVLSKDDDWKIRETEHFFIHVRPRSTADFDIEMIAAHLEDCFNKVTSYLDVRYDSKIRYLLYSSLEDKQKNSLAKGTMTFAMPTIETIVGVYIYADHAYGYGIHEIVHIVSYWTIGIGSSDMLAEGLAVVMSGGYTWNMTAHAAAAQYLKQGKLKPLATMFDNKAWSKVMDENSDLYYNQAGSFVQYLISRFGITAFKAFYNRASSSEYEKTFREICGLAVQDFHADWLRGLESGTLR